ncbi:hypothetical protein JTB14_019380 [Gonioctena quinquepunctata]|nr:hypothetical protein JTB14_019380 [Gonioctena quinquepunctata]
MDFFCKSNNLKTSNWQIPESIILHIKTSIVLGIHISQKNISDETEISPARLFHFQKWIGNKSARRGIEFNNNSAFALPIFTVPFCLAEYNPELFLFDYIAGALSILNDIFGFTLNREASFAIDPYFSTKSFSNLLVDEIFESDAAIFRF